MIDTFFNVLTIKLTFVLAVALIVDIYPSKMIPKMSSQNIDAILVHELAHIRRSDCAWQLLQRIIEAALWFHPFIWIAQRRIAFIRERACDDFAVHLVGDFEVYGETLLDIAAGMQRRKTFGLGLAITRSNSLVHRLSAIAQSDGCGQCLASPRVRCLLTAGIIFATVGLASVTLGRVSAQEAPAEKNVEADLTPQIKSPELIAVTWQQIREWNNKRIQQPVWRPDGTRLTEIEANSLLEEAEGFQSHWWNMKDDLRPLVFLFRANLAIQSGVMTGIVMPDEKRIWTGSWGYMTSNGLAKSAVSPNRSELKKWPAKIDLQIRVPLENPTLIQTIDSVTDEHVAVGPGVRWYIDQQKGIDYRSQPPRTGLTAAVLEIRNDRQENLTKFSASIWMKGEKQPLPEEYVTNIEPKPGIPATIRVSRPIDDPKNIEKVEFYRQRFRMELINDVETHLDLIPTEKSD